MKKIILLLILLLGTSYASNSQVGTKSTDSLLAAPTKFKLLAANISYQGEECLPSDKTHKVYTDSSDVLRIGDEVFYSASRFYQTYTRDGLVVDGLVVENFLAQTCRIYRILGLAKTAGWKNSADVPSSIRGLFRVGNTLWMGSNGIGVAVFDLERKTWSRYDLKSDVIAGDHLNINYADDNYAFVIRGEFPGASLHIYSVKQNKWLGLKAVSTKLVREYGFTTGMVQVPVDHRFYARQKYLPIDWTFMGLRVTPIDNSYSYLIEKNFSETKTVFEINKSQLEQFFKKSS